MLEMNKGVDKALTFSDVVLPQEENYYLMIRTFVGLTSLRFYKLNLTENKNE